MGKQKQKNQVKPLPTNVEHATRSYVREHAASWDAKILAERGARLGVAPEAAFPSAAQPLYLIEANARAQAEGRSVDSILDDYRERLAQSTYPGPNCLLPDDVLACMEEGELPAEMQAHAGTCPACATLLEMARHRPKIDLPVSEDAPAQDPVAAGVFKPAMAITSPTRRQALANWAAVVLLPGLLVSVVYLALWGRNSSATRLTFMDSKASWLIAALMGIAMYFVFKASRITPIVRNFAVGLGLAAVAITFFVNDYKQSNRLLAVETKQPTLGSTLAEMQVASICGNLVARVDETGKLPTPQSFDSDFRLESDSTSGSKGTYTFTRPELSGKVVCVIGPGGGYGSWDDGKMRSSSVRLVSGKVDPSGEYVRVIDNGQVLPLLRTIAANSPRPGAYVVAAQDSQTDALRPVVHLAYVPTENDWRKDTMPDNHALPDKGPNQ